MTGQIEASVRVEDRDDDWTAGSLYRWLTQDPLLRRDVTVSLRQDLPGSGEMGAAVDLIDVVLSNSIAVGSLLVAIASWRRSRPRPPTTRFERDGVSIVIEDASPETVRRVVAALGDRSAEARSAGGAEAPRVVDDEPRSESESGAPRPAGDGG